MLEWSVAAVGIKSLLYATSLSAGGGVLFLAIFASQMSAAERWRIVRFVRVAALGAIVLTVARLMVLSGMLGDDIAGLWD